MDENKLFSTLSGSYHDSIMLNVAYKDGSLYVQCFRSPPDPYDDPQYRYVVIRFDNVRDIQYYDWGKHRYFPAKVSDFVMENGCPILEEIDYIYSLDYEDDYVIFEECIKFRADDVELLDHSNESLDFEKYIK